MELRNRDCSGCITRREAISIMSIGGVLLMAGLPGCSNASSGYSNTGENESQSSANSIAPNVITPLTAFNSQERVLWYEVIWGVGKDSDVQRLHVVENGEVTSYHLGGYISLSLGQIAEASDDKIIEYIESKDAEHVEKDPSIFTSVKKTPRVVQAVIRTDQTGNKVSGEGIINSEDVSSIGTTDWIYKSSIIGEEWMDGTESASEVYSATYAGFRGPAGDTHLSLIRRIDPGMTFALDDLNSPDVIVVD